MSFSTTLTALSAVIRKIAGYDTSNVSIEDYRPLGAGKTKAAVLGRGSSTRRRISLGNPATMENTWGANIELFLPFKTEVGSLASDVLTEAQKIVDEVDKWPSLDGASGVVMAEAELVGEPEEWVAGGRWWRQLIQVKATELVAVAQSE